MNKKVGILRKYALKAALKRHEDFQEFLGVKMRKLPSDCLAIMKLLNRCRPKVVIETGSQRGGSALMIATFAQSIGLEEVISLDVAPVPRLEHPMIKFITGDSSSPEISARVHALVGGRPCTLILDSNHFTGHVLKELRLYHDLVGKGQGLVVEDTHVDVLKFREFKKEGGPLLALDEFLKSEKSFVEAEGVEPYVTTNYFGYLVRR